jgi:cyclopropane fatty-acyl-phospholipid synthase-like methyltransferase
MRRVVVEQFKHPHGVLGHAAGWIMAHRESNLLRNEWVVSELGIEPDHRVLEVGCGPGIALGRAVELASKGKVIGIDHSALMVRAAARRNASAVASGRLELVHADADAVTDLEGPFDRVYAVNVVQFWESPADTLRRVRRMMAPDGVIAIALQPRNKGATDEDAYRAGERNEALLRKAGFHAVRVEMLDLEPKVACVFGRAQRSG